MHNDGPRILFVENDPLLAEVTAFRLELLGYQVDVVSTGEEALITIERNIPQVAVVDLVLPGMTGVELIERIASRHQSAEIPIMALSIEADIDAVQRAYNAGALDYLVAPYDPMTLENKVERLVRRQSTDSM